MKRLLFTVLALAALVPAAFSQAQDEIVTIKVVPSVEVFKAGQTAAVTLEVSIRAPYHVQSDQPSEDYLIATTVEFKSRAGVTIERIKFPRGEMRKLSLSENPLSIYEGTVKITADITVAADFAGAEFAIEGTLGYQACDDTSCLPPADIPFVKIVKVEGGRPAVPAGAEKIEAAPPAGKQAQKLEEKPPAAAVETPAGEVSDDPKSAEAPAVQKCGGRAGGDLSRSRFG